MSDRGTRRFARFGVASGELGEGSVTAARHDSLYTLYSSCSASSAPGPPHPHPHSAPACPELEGDCLKTVRDTPKRPFQSARAPKRRASARSPQFTRTTHSSYLPLQFCLHFQFHNLALAPPHPHVPSWKVTV